MNKLLTILASLLIASIGLAAPPSINDIKVAQAVKTVPPVFADRTFSPVANSLFGFDSSVLPVNVTVGAGLTLDAITHVLSVPANSVSANSLTGTTLASNVVNSSLTSVGTLANLTVTGSINLVGGTVTGLPTPVAATDAVTKTYADAIAGGIVPRSSAIVATTANITLSGTQTIDGQAVTAGQRVLVKNQTSTFQNGIYDCAVGAWARSSDSNTAAQLKAGYEYFVSTGTQAATNWVIQTAPVVLNTDPVVFTQYSAAQNYSAGAGLALAGNSFSVNAAQSGVTSLGTLTSLTTSGQITSTLATGTAPLAVSSTTVNPNLNAAFLNGNTFANPGPIGATASTGNFTILTATAPDGANGIYSKGASGQLVTIPYYDATNGAILASQNLAGSSVLPLTDNSLIRRFLVGNVLVGTFTSTGLNGTDIGQTTAGKGTFTTLNGTSGTFTGVISTANNTAYSFRDSGGVLRRGLLMDSTNDIYVGAVDNASTSSLILAAGTTGNIKGFVNGSQTLAITSTGINSTDIGQGTAGKGSFTTLTGSVTSTGAVTSRTLANRANDWTNVLDYGADPTGAVDSSTALNAAVAACPTTRGTLFFPPGRYKWTAAGGFTISGKTNLTIFGAGAELYDGNNAGARPFVVIDKTNSYVKMTGLAFNGNAVARVAGAHQLIFNASHSIVSGCTFANGSQFTFYIGSDNTQLTTDVVVSDCHIYNTWADGFHLYYVRDVVLANCSTNITGDDGIGIIADTATYNPSRITLLNFNAVQAGNAAGGGTHGVSIRINEANDVHIVGGSSIQAAEAGIVTGRFNSTTFYNTRIKIDGFKSYQDAAYTGGGRYGGGIDLQFASQVEVNTCRVDSPTRTGAGGIGALDCNNLTISGCTVSGVGFRSILTDDGTTANVAATWSNWSITGNTLLGTPSNESIYVVPATGKTIANLIVSGNNEIGAPAGNYIVTNRLATAAKIVNNTSMEGRTIANGGSGLAPTTANNN